MTDGSIGYLQHTAYSRAYQTVPSIDSDFLCCHWAAAADSYMILFFIFYLADECDMTVEPDSACAWFLENESSHDSVIKLVFLIWALTFVPFVMSTSLLQLYWTYHISDEFQPVCSRAQSHGSQRVSYYFGKDRHILHFSSQC